MEATHLQFHVAPFVEKTYLMVSDPSTDDLIKWGEENNSFLVRDPSEFARRLLPVYFKHKNFSSFVRQLNTYGFRKVDYGRWEFAHECFIRGQTYLLPSISRRKKAFTSPTTSSKGESMEYNSEDEDDILMLELQRLKKEQLVLDQELHNMNQRLEATEVRPQQMLSFLMKSTGDPNLLSRLLSTTSVDQQTPTKALLASPMNVFQLEAPDQTRFDGHGYDDDGCGDAMIDEYTNRATSISPEFELGNLPMRSNPPPQTMPSFNHGFFY